MWQYDSKNKIWCWIKFKILENFVFLWFSLIFIKILIKISSKQKSKMIKNNQKWSNYVKCDSKNRFLMSDWIKIMKNLVFRWFSIIIILDFVQKRFKTVQKDQKKSKIIENSQKWSKHVKMWFKKWISDIKIDQNHGKLTFSMN